MRFGIRLFSCWLLALAGCGLLHEAGAAPAGSFATPPPALKLSPAQQAQANWRQAIAAAGSVVKGCAVASYPALHWTEVPCGMTKFRPLHVFTKRVASVPGQVTPEDQSRTDDIATVSGVMTSAAGSFRNAVDFETVTGAAAGPSAFSLQLNSNGFDNRATCASSGCAPCAGQGCYAVQQWGLLASPGGTNAFVQYWLVNYDPTTDPAHSKLGSCPAGWTYSAYDPTHPGELPGCRINGPCPRASATAKDCTLPALAITGLNGVTLTGELNAAGYATLIVTYGEAAYAATDTSNPIGLAGNWKQAEFNIFGQQNGDNSTINFGALTGIEIAVNGNPGQMGSVSCQTASSFTAEYTNLSIDPANCYSGTLNGVSQIDFDESVPPNVLSISPATGPMAGGTKIDITGQGFLPSTPQNQGADNLTLVGFDDTNFVPATCDSDTHCTAVTPRVGSYGDFFVRAINSTSSFTSVETGGFVQFAYTLGPQGIFSPGSGPVGGGTSVTIYGSDLFQEGSQPVVDLQFTNGTVAAALDAYGVPQNSPYSEYLTFTTPPLKPAGRGPVSVPVSLTVAGATASIGNFVYGPPKVTPPPPSCKCGAGLQCCLLNTGRTTCVAVGKCPILQ